MADDSKLSWTLVWHFIHSWILGKSLECFRILTAPSSPVNITAPVDKELVQGPKTSKEESGESTAHWIATIWK